jgi:hypothetical protein
VVDLGVGRELTLRDPFSIIYRSWLVTTRTAETAGDVAPTSRTSLLGRESLCWDKLNDGVVVAQLYNVLFGSGV